MAVRFWWVVSWLVQVGSWHPICRDPSRVSLVTDFRFSAVNPYNSRVRSTGPKGPLPFFRENHGSYPAETQSWAGMPVALVRLGTGHLWAHPFPSLTLWVPGAVVEPIDGPTFELLDLGAL